MSDQQPQSLSFGTSMPVLRQAGVFDSPHPDHDLTYELQVFTCSACHHTIERIVDANGNPPQKPNCCD
jgi:hypothetical protein